VFISTHAAPRALDRVDPAHVLDARTWLLRLLAEDALPEPPVLPSAAWRASLRQERCAAPVKSRVAAWREEKTLPAELSSPLEERALEEWQRILMARAQLHQLEQIAREHGIRIVVLKGGVAAVAQQEAVDLVDIDVLARPSEAHMLARLLDEAGYAGEGFSSTQHLRSRVRRGSLMVEVHQELDVGDPTWSAGVWNRIVPIQGMSHLLRLAPQDHLWHLLYHVGVAHPYRRSALRDLLLTSAAVAECAEGEIAALTQRIDPLPQRKVVADLLAMADELHNGSGVGDRFARLVVELVVIQNCVRWLPLSGQPQASVGISATAIVSGLSDVRREWGRVRMWTIDGSSNRAVAWFEQIGPRVGRAVRVTVRAARTALAMALALPIAVVAAAVSYRVTKSRSAGVRAGAQP
jgi:hypothetical protein